MLEFGFYNMDCLEGMRQFPDNYFELAVVDPPYGIGYDVAAEKEGGKQYANAQAPKRFYHAGGWDSQTPDDEYFNELFRVSKNQIVWGGGTITNSYHLRRALFVGTKDAATISETTSRTASSLGYLMSSESRECIGLYGPG